MSQTGVLTAKGNLDTQRETRNVCAQKDTKWEHGKKVVICEPTEEASGEAKLDDTLILDFWPSELWNKRGRIAVS